MENLEIYNKVRAVPKEALKEIGAGRLKGKSDINPMWRIKALTEAFGMCGFGWKYEILSERLENGANDEIAAFVKINLFVKVDGQWSEPIPGTGGSSFVAKEKSGMYVSDECFKMALTDAISVSCKALGFGADVYWNADSTKYSKKDQAEKDQAEKPQQPQHTPAYPKLINPLVITEAQAKRLFAISNGNVALVKETCLKYGYTSSKDVSKSDYDKIVADIEKGIATAV